MYQFYVKAEQSLRTWNCWYV